jgi:uncharacterized protein YqgV (UPF0045/DUF77 family)
MAETHLSLQVLPVVPEASVYPVVDLVIDLIRRSGLPYIVGPMETSIEGDLDQLLNLVQEAQHICVAAGASRVVSIVKIDYKPAGVSFDEKLEQYR